MKPPDRKYRQPKKTGPDMSNWSPEERAARLHTERMATPVAEIQLPVRVINTLEENDVILVVDLMRQTYETLMKMKNFGEKTMTEVRAAIEALGLTPPPGWKKPPKTQNVRLPRPKKGNNPFEDW